MGSTSCHIMSLIIMSLGDGTHTHRHTDRQIDKQTDRQTHKHTNTHTSHRQNQFLWTRSALVTGQHIPVLRTCKSICSNIKCHTSHISHSFWLELVQVKTQSNITHTLVITILMRAVLANNSPRTQITIQKHIYISPNMACT